MSTSTTQPAIGFIGLGDQGLPMVTAIGLLGSTVLSFLVEIEEPTAKAA